MTRKPLNINDSDYGDNKLIKPAMIENLLKFISSDELDTYTNDQILTAYYELNYDTLSLDEYNDYIDLLYKKDDWDEDDWDEDDWDEDDWDEDDWIDANLDEDDFQIYMNIFIRMINLLLLKLKIFLYDEDDWDEDDWDEDDWDEDDWDEDDWDEDDWIDANLEDDFQIYWSFHKNPTNIKATKYNIITSDINYPPHEHIYPDDKLVITKIEDISIYCKIIYLTKNGDEFYTYDDAFNYRNNFGFWQLFVEVFDK